MAEMENVRLYEPKKRMAHIVAIGGGHGLSAMLRGLKRYTKYITAIVTVADDGGGSGMLREDLGMTTSIPLLVTGCIIPYFPLGCNFFFCGVYFDAAAHVLMGEGGRLWRSGC